MTDPIPESKLAELERLCEAEEANYPSGWFAQPVTSYRCGDIPGSKGYVVRSEAGPTCLFIAAAGQVAPNLRTRVQLVAEARNALPALIAEARRLRERCHSLAHELAFHQTLNERNPLIAEVRRLRELGNRLAHELNYQCEKNGGPNYANKCAPLAEWNAAREIDAEAAAQDGGG